MNYHLDPLTAITARPEFWRYTGNYSVEKGKIPTADQKKYTYSMIVKQFHIGCQTIRDAKIALFGELVQLNEGKYNKLIDYLKDKINKPKYKKGLNIATLAAELDINKFTAVSISKKLLGKGSGYTTEEYETLKNHLATVKIEKRGPYKT